MPASMSSCLLFPSAEPNYSKAISPKTRGQDDKIAAGLSRLNEEDPTFTVVNNGETHQMVPTTAGDIQTDVLVSKLKTASAWRLSWKEPRVAYREKIRKVVSKQGRHKKQTGGSGQFGDVWIRFEPNPESEEPVFAEEVFGGSVPKNFFPAVEKGHQGGLRPRRAGRLPSGQPEGRAVRWKLPPGRLLGNRLQDRRPAGLQGRLA